jgi:hypothetical protein
MWSLIHNFARQIHDLPPSSLYIHVQWGATLGTLHVANLFTPGR